MTAGHHFAMLTIFVGALLGGMAVAGSGCCACPELDPLEPSTWRIVESHDPDLIGGTVQAHEDEVEITYTRGDGTTWTVVYAVEDRVP